MFKEVKSAGKHMICDIKKIKNMELLNDSIKLNEMLEFICRYYNFNVMDKVEKIFEPQGCTILYLLSESHLSIHTFPEKNFLSFDLYTCRIYEDNKEYFEILDFLIDHLKADPIETKCTIIDREF